MAGARGSRGGTRGRGRGRGGGGGGGGGGIRKRKAKNRPGKQTLAKVAARGGGYDDGLGDGFGAALPRAVRTEPEDLLETGGSSSDEAEGEEAESAAGRATADYEALIGGLVVAESGVEVPRGGAAKRRRVAVNGLGDAVERTKVGAGDGGNGGNGADAAGAAAEGGAEDLSGEGARRENAHFGAEITAPEVKALVGEGYQYAPSVEVRGVGKVSEAARANASMAVVGADEALRNLWLNALGLQPTVLARWRAWSRGSVGEDVLDPGAKLANSEAALVLALGSWRDVLYCRDVGIAEERRMRQLVVGHVLSHALRARSRVLRNDAKLKAREDGGEAAEDEQEDEARDQGFARPRVLILAPMRNDVYDIVNQISKLAVGTGDGEKGVAQIANHDRFQEEFGSEDAESEDLEEGAGRDEGEGGGGAGKRRKKKPEDWKHRFRGNVDDDFKLGISLTKKTVKLYSDFYNSDIIIASPLGLVRSMEVKKSGAGRKGVKKRETREKNRAVDDWNAGADKLNQVAKKKTNFAEDDEADDDGFLSSIEICVVDGASTFAMQNWSLLLSTLERINNMPSRPRDTDFSRVRQWALDGYMRHFRQTVVLAPHKRADALSLFRCFANHSGRVRILNAPTVDGAMCDVMVSMRQRFLRVEDIASPSDAPDRHFADFMGKVMPELRAAVDSQALVVVPNYFDFVRVRNALVTLEADEVGFRFASMSEYSKESDVARAKTRFYTRKVSILVMTERLHYYWRSNIRGANTVVWYGLPEHGGFYAEIVNTLAEAAERGRPVQTLALYDDYEAFALERIVGTTRARKMTGRAARSAYLFTH